MTRRTRYLARHGEAAAGMPNTGLTVLGYDEGPSVVECVGDFSHLVGLEQRLEQDIPQDGAR